MSNKEKISDNVNHPKHYTQNGIECIKAIEASMSPEGFQDYCKGNIIKYIWRWRDKNKIEDLNKAKVYLGWLIESAEKSEKSIKKNSDTKGDSLYFHSGLSLVFDTYKEAHNVLTMIKNVMIAYGYVSVADVEDIMNIANNWTSYKFGWYLNDIFKFGIKFTNDNKYMILFPKAMPLDEFKKEGKK